MIEKGDILVAVDDFYMNSSNDGFVIKNQFLTKGKEYEVVDTPSLYGEFEIIDDAGDLHYFDGVCLNCNHEDYMLTTKLLWDRKHKLENV